MLQIFCCKQYHKFKSLFISYRDESLLFQHFSFHSWCHITEEQKNLYTAYQYGKASFPSFCTTPHSSLLLSTRTFSLFSFTFNKCTWTSISQQRKTVLQSNCILDTFFVIQVTVCYRKCNQNPMPRDLVTQWQSISFIISSITVVRSDFFLPDLHLNLCYQLKKTNFFKYVNILQCILIMVKIIVSLTFLFVWFGNGRQPKYLQYTIVTEEFVVEQTGQGAKEYL